MFGKFAGKGTSINKNKERVDFGEPIGKYYDRNTGEYRETTKAMIHYGKDGSSYKYHPDHKNIRKEDAYGV
ncbi:polymorphic toxin type 50 domain-containing protein [Virgibacillus proomii]|uniref:polymorphic toxin type 50 domain-containing protein n=1 Tax=Virgibacillus proomii TaxID=84407 RepID=UPI00209EB31A|nr:polymorphic toxin type 50 domain-containing protein [Virgibacillus proomii]